MAKKLVRVNSSAATPPNEPTWKPTPEAKGKAGRLRLIAALLWLLAIGAEGGTIFWVLKQSPVNMVLLIAAIVVIGILAVVGSLLWKSANRADPAPRSEPTRFFIQNQLGAIITMIAFLPLIVMIFLNKNMSKSEKGVAGTIAIVIALIAAYFGATFNSPSSDQPSAAEVSRVVAITGADLVFWTKDGSVYHLCRAAHDVNITSQDNQIYEGTVAQAHEQGKSRLTLKVPEEISECGFTTVDPGINGTTTPVTSPTP